VLICTHAQRVVQIVARADADGENLGTLLRNLIIKQHIELSRGAFVFLRARGLLARNLQPPPTARELAAARKREANASAAKAGEFNADDEFIDLTGRRLVCRSKIGRRYFYEHTPVGLPYHYIASNAYRKPNSCPDKWCGDYFLDSYEEPILFRCRSFADPLVVEYQRVVTTEKLKAIIDSDDAEYFRLVEEDEQRVHDDAEESEEEAAAEAERVQADAEEAAAAAKEAKEADDDVDEAVKAEVEAELAAANPEPAYNKRPRQEYERELLRSSKATNLRSRRVLAAKPKTDGALP